MTVGMCRKPCIFVSSTCYDLSQVRYDIKSFIENDIGYEAVLSEFQSFPLDPSIGTIENCLRVVQERADIFVLVLGGRYGHETDSGKSVTNLEYIHAQAKNIPIYVFVSKTVLTAINIWKENLDADFSTIVDTTKIFEFVEQLRSQDNVWVYPFEFAHDIIQVLKQQFGYLFYDSLQYRKQIASAGLSDTLNQLKGNSLKTVLEKPTAWEYILFGSVLQDGIDSCKNIKMDYTYNIHIGKRKKIQDVHELAEWLKEKTSELGMLSNTLASLFNVALSEAVGPDGKPGNAEHIIYVALNVIKTYKAIIEWAIEFDKISVEDTYNAVLVAARKFSATVIEDIEEYCIRYNKTLAEALILPINEEKPIHLDLSLTLRGLNLEEFNNEIERLEKLIH